MSQLNNPMAILKLLDKSNCGECGSPTCLAFAGAVFKGQKQIDECPHLDSDIIEQFEKEGRKIAAPKPNSEEPLEQLKIKLSAIDLSSAARRLDAKYANNKLTIKVCGKDFSVDSKGNFSSEIHIHSWITIPLLNYIIDGAGKPVSGNWVSFRELKGGKDWHGFFVHQCEKPLKKVADTYTDLFEDMLHIFNGKRVENHYESDISLVLYPLPKLPILICYWKPEDGLESSLNIFFDSTASDNLNIESIYSLGTGLTTMFEKISLRHGFK
jgi:uncharacterized protein DUF3786/putative Fe-S cluster protein